ncbi:MAG: UDP-glucose/GDP-mannose dehydrogenase family protein [Candidatus Omnitrophica bacterium]|nr:UDP-glucose/GDP-mannose dehydrogenase family protein [Candidatus Omnitrophota bacterium]MCF7878716.1 UDP-glucose/GDP-mannose dehydrogenase family protein [Candidatus Omnitrophota bacterium]MCF7892948.1 UDP-glucose/GDP-mannose dehydrogenase family protein [Candidatus Omnitrophota bacterium]
MTKKNKKYKICVVGAGHVGLIAAVCFAKLGHKVICADNDKKKIEQLRRGKPVFYEPELQDLLKRVKKKNNLRFSTSLAAAAKGSEVIFIAVGTPPLADGSADLASIEAVARTIADNLNSYKLIVGKSTVPVQTGQKIKEVINRYKKNSAPFDIASNPEFLREGKAIYDFFYPDRIVLGVESKRAEKILRDIYRDIKTKVIVTDIAAAEIIKHASNSFLAAKISFINAVARVCDKAGADVKSVAAAMGLDKRIGKSFLNAGVGFGGFCFPKDVEAFIYIAKRLGYEFDFLKEVRNINIKQPGYFVEKIKEHLWILKNKKIAVLGLSFKPDTDDMRFSPAISIVNNLVKEGASLKLYDPQGIDEAKKVLKKSTKIKFAKNSYEAAKGCDCVCVLTEWEEFKKINLKNIKNNMNYPLLADGRNIFDKNKVTKLGFSYLGIGR